MTPPWLSASKRTLKCVKSLSKVTIPPKVAKRKRPSSISKTSRTPRKSCSYRGGAPMKSLRKPFCRGFQRNTPLSLASQTLP